MYPPTRRTARPASPLTCCGAASRRKGVGGQATYFREPAILEFIDGEARKIHSYEVTVNVAKPAPRPGDTINTIYSLLGRDVIDHWLMVYHRRNDRLEFTVSDED